TGVQLVGTSGRPSPNNHFLHVDITGISVLGIDVNDFSDSDLFDFVHIGLSASNATGVSVGTAGTSGTGASCARLQFVTLLIDTSGGTTGQTGVALGYYQGNPLVFPALQIGELGLGGSQSQWLDPVLDKRAAVSGGTTAVADYLINIVNDQVVTQLGIANGTEADDNTGDRTAADGAAVTVVTPTQQAAYEFDMRMLLTAYNAATGTVTYTLTYTDWGGNARSVAITGAALNAVSKSSKTIYVGKNAAVQVQATASGSWTSTTAHIRARFRQTA
ncbi:MAG: hypothetical protein L3J97_07065, partial [Thermoplasmata archaeon]|nr:hypothetical protein [Thermoplasmata archaeon]